MNKELNDFFAKMEWQLEYEQLLLDNGIGKCSCGDRIKRTIKIIKSERFISV